MTSTAWWATGIVIFYLSFFIWYAIMMDNRNKKRKTEAKTKLFKALVNGLKTGIITNLDDVVNIYISIAGLSPENTSYRYGLSNYLRELLVSVVSNDKNILGESLEPNTLTEWKNKISNFIEKNEEVAPYANLPSAERNILNDLTVFIMKDEKESAKRKTLEIAGMIEARSNDLEKIQNSNKRNSTLAILGFILTIMAVVIAIVK